MMGEPGMGRDMKVVTRRDGGAQDPSRRGLIPAEFVGANGASPVPMGENSPFECKLV